MTLGDLVEAIEASGLPLDTEIMALYGCNFPDELQIKLEGFGEGHPFGPADFATIGEPTP